LKPIKIQNGEIKMDVIKMTRELGKAIQSDERYENFQQTKKNNEADSGLNALMGKLNLAQMSYQNESESENPDNAKMDAYDKEFHEIYGELMQNPNMLRYEASRIEIDKLMNHIMQLLALCVNGADPDTCEPEAANCGSGCAACGGCG